MGELPEQSPVSRFWSELRRRRVTRVIILYTVAGWAVIEVASTVLPNLNRPKWIVTLVTALVASQEFATPTITDDQATAPSSFTPANFVEGKKSLKNRVNFPRVKDDVHVVVTCDSHATARERIDDARCSSPHDPELKYTLAVRRAARSARLTPAIVNGKKQDVVFQFSVVFSRQGDTETISVYPHSRNNVERYGLNYIGAQAHKLSVFPKSCIVNNISAAYIVMAVVHVASDGTPKQIELVEGQIKPPKACRKSLLQRMRNALWIPAFHQGSPVESISVIPYWISDELYIF